jgi:hypothetical protein
MDYICFYNSPCDDGELAKEIWRRKYPKSTFFPWIRSKEKDNVKFLRKFKFEHIVFLGYCPNVEYLVNNNKYLVIDHHYKAINCLKETNNINIYSDFNRSTCMLVWDFLYPDEEYPIAIYHIGMSNIYKFEDVHTEPFCIVYKKFKLKPIELFTLKRTDILYKDIIFIGFKDIVGYRLDAINLILKMKFEVDILDGKSYKILSVFCDKLHLHKYLLHFAQLNFSEYNILKIKKSKGIIENYSLKSIDGTNVDKLAEKYGGGGNKLSAGYVIKLI